MKEMIVDEYELQIFNTGFQKRTGQLNQSRFCYYSRDPGDLLKTQPSLVDTMRLCTITNYVSKHPNAVYSGIEQKTATVVRDMIEKNNSADVRWCEEDVYGEQSVVNFLQVY